MSTPLFFTHFEKVRENSNTPKTSQNLPNLPQKSFGRFSPSFSFGKDSLGKNFGRGFGALI